MKRTLPQSIGLVFLFCLSAVTAWGQVGLTGSTPQGILDLSTSSYGFVFPRIALTDAATETITQPDGSALAAGTVVYNTGTSGSGNNAVYPGLYVWTGSKWTTQTPRKDFFRATQDSDLRTGSDDGTYGDQSISFDNSSFTPQFSGDYQVILTVNYGGGEVDDPSTSGTYPNQLVNFNKQEGTVEFILNGTTHSFEMNSYSGKNTIFGTLEYTNEINQKKFVFIEALTEGVSYPFTLTMNQEDADGFEADGDVSGPNDGRGYIIQDGLMECTVEFKYIGN